MSRDDPELGGIAARVLVPRLEVVGVRTHDVLDGSSAEHHDLNVAVIPVFALGLEEPCLSARRVLERALLKQRAVLGSEHHYEMLQLSRLTVGLTCLRRNTGGLARVERRNRA